jgi:hypothetical protein
VRKKRGKGQKREGEKREGEKRKKNQNRREPPCSAGVKLNIRPISRETPK